jgi:uncharacterized protein with HEPN domain
MQLSDRDLAYLVDMLSCCNDILEFTADVSFEAFERDKMRRFATERQLEILGEAANHVSTAAREQLAEIDWPRIIGLRNKLAHDYGEVLAERVWRIAVNSIPELRSRLTAINEVWRALADSDTE